MQTCNTCESHVTYAPAEEQKRKLEHFQEELARCLDPDEAWHTTPFCCAIVMFGNDIYGHLKSSEVIWLLHCFDLLRNLSCKPNCQRCQHGESQDLTGKDFAKSFGSSQCCSLRNLIMAQFRRVRWSLDDLDVEIAPEAQITRQAEELEDNKAQASQDTAQYEENVT